MRLAGKIAIVTGAAGGMGQAAAILFARHGAKVVGVDLSEAAMADTLAQIAQAGGTAIAVACDISKADAVEALVARTVAQFGLPNVMFNAAGVDFEEMKSLFEISEDAFDRTVAVNLKGAWLMMKYAVPKMIEAGGGSIVHVSSTTAWSTGLTPAYTGSKAGLLSLTRAAAAELAPYKIRVNTICPGATWTPMAARARAEIEAQGLAFDDSHLLKMSPFGRMAVPEEMAHMGLYLASDEASYANGLSIANDSGWMAARSYNGAAQ